MVNRRGIMKFPNNPVTSYKLATFTKKADR